MTVGLLLVTLIVILFGSEAFTNALEHLGERLGISEGVTGSVFAAVGTALPETIVPIVAVLASGNRPRIGQEVGIGAILGAPLMLSTLTLFLMAVFASARRGWKGAFKPERSGLERDLRWFLLAFGLSAAAIFVPHQSRIARDLIAMTLVLVYFAYILLTVRASSRLVTDGHGTEADQPLHLARIGLPETLMTIVLQLVVALVLIVLGTRGFVVGVEDMSAWIGISALSLSLLIVPIATELPEKINSILWIRRNRDTLAFGNITGAMVFQGSLLPAIGIMLTPWEPRPEVVAALAIPLVASAYLLIMVRRGTLRPVHLVVNGLLYAGYFGALLWATGARH